MNHIVAEMLKQEGNGPLDLQAKGQLQQHLGSMMTISSKAYKTMCILPSVVIMLASEDMVTSKWLCTLLTPGLKFETSSLDYHIIYVHIAFKSHFGGL